MVPVLVQYTSLQGGTTNVYIVLLDYVFNSSTE